MRAAVVAVVLAASVSAAAAPDEPIVLVGGDDAFRAALADALIPAGMTVVTVADPPSPTIGDVTAQSRSLADHDRATATVWLVEENGTATLVTYDRDVDRALVRALPYTLPLSPTQAAEAARMARTMLRALRVTPDVDLAPPHVAEAIEVRQRAAAPIPPPLPIEAPPAPPLLAFELLGGVRFGGPAVAGGALGGAAIRWRPEGLGAALAGSVAPRGDVRTSGFTGTIRDDALALTTRWSVPIAESFSVAAELGAALHFMDLAGALAGGGDVSRARIDPAVRAGIGCAYALGAFSLGIEVVADALVRRQTYDVDATEVLQIPVLQISAGLGLSARLP